MTTYLDSVGVRARVNRTVQWLLRGNRWIWVLPLFVFEFVRHEEARIPKAIEVLLGAAMLVLVTRRPRRWLVVLLVVLPFQTLLLAALLRFGMPAEIVRGLRFWREAIVFGLALAALKNLRDRRERGSLHFDILDKVALAYVVLGTAFLIFPTLLVGSGPGAHFSFFVRELGWRGDVLYVGIFLVFRHLSLSREDVEGVFRKVLGAGVIAALVGIFEFFDPHAWVRFVNQTLQLTTYNYRIIGNVTDPWYQEAYGSVGGHSFPRIGSVLVDYLGAGFFWVICLGIAVEMLTRGKQRWWIVAGTPVVGVALLMNQGRSAIIGGAVAVLFGLRAQVGRSLVHRVRLGAALVLLLIVAVPVLLTGGLFSRFSHSSNSNTGHIAATKAGIGLMERNPIGRGLSTGAGAGQVESKGSIGAQTDVVTEDQWLQIGTQFGYLGLGLYVATIALIFRRLKPRDEHALPAAMPAAASRNALVGLLVVTFVLQPFVIDPIDWTLFGLCGIAAGLIDASYRAPSEARQRYAAAAVTA